MPFLKIGGAALNQTPIDWDNNTNNIKEAIVKARAEGIRILCLPELCITGYGCEDLFLSEWLPVKALSCLILLKDYCEDITVSMGLPIRIENKTYNCACLIRNKEILGISAKQHLAKDGVHYEPRWFTAWKPNDQMQLTIEGKSYIFGDVIYETEGIKIGFEICEDAWIHEDLRPAKIFCSQKVDLILNPSASHFSFGKSQIRYDLIIDSSDKFNCTYLYADLLGNEAGRIIYDGEVLIAKNGKLIQRNNRLSFEKVNLVSAEINFKTGETNEQTLNHDEREKEYEFWEATSLGLFDYLRKSKSKGFVLSLSGGADSSACAIMVVEMVKKGLAELGPVRFIETAGLTELFDIPALQAMNNVSQEKTILGKILVCAYQSTENSGSQTFLSAQQLATALGAVFYSWDVQEEISGYTQKIEHALGRKLSWHQDDIALQNIQARGRAPVIWMLANINKALLITTSNRSEGDVGYATMDGDTSGSIAPLAGVDKDFIRRWLIWAERVLNHPALSNVNALSPTAELRPAANVQTDEKDLMPYVILAAIEREAIRHWKSPVEVFQILESQSLESADQLKKHIIKFFTLWSRNQWKRERIAPSFHLDDFNVDPRSWCRFPILSGNFEAELKLLAGLKD